MKFENFNPEIHDVHEVATLIYDVDFRTFDMLFSDKNKAVLAIEKYLDKDESIWLILDDLEKIIGMVIFWVNKKPSFWHSFKQLTSFGGLKLFIVDILDHFVLCDVLQGDVHVAELAISSSQRGKGLGREVLNLVIEESKKRGFNRVTLDADFRNTGAKSLYERIGFKTFNKKRVKIGSFERGMSNMEYTL